MTLLSETCHRLSSRWISLALLAAQATWLQALDMRYVPEYWLSNQSITHSAPPSIHLSGAVGFADRDQLAQMLKRHRDAPRIVAEESPGGVLDEGIVVPELIYSRDLDVRLVGPAASAATLIGLSARQRFEFYPDWSRTPGGSQLLVHCAYVSADEGCDKRGTRAAAGTIEWLTQYPSGTSYRVMMDTPPSTVVRVRLETILKADSWGCGRSTLLDGDDVMECERVNAVIRDQPKPAKGRYVTKPEFCWAEYQRAS